jgi:phage head maturation protease
LSIGLSDDAQFSRRDGMLHGRLGNQLVEISLTPSPAFDDARVSAVAAEADHNERKYTMTNAQLDALANQFAERLASAGLPAGK